MNYKSTEGLTHVLIRIEDINEEVSPLYESILKTLFSCLNTRII